MFIDFRQVSIVLPVNVGISKDFLSDHVDVIIRVIQSIINVLNSVLDYVISYEFRVNYELLPSCDKRKQILTDCLGIVIRSGTNINNIRSATTTWALIIFVQAYKECILHINQHFLFCLVLYNIFEMLQFPCHF